MTAVISRFISLRQEEVHSFENYHSLKALSAFTYI